MERRSHLNMVACFILLQLIFLLSLTSISFGAEINHVRSINKVDNVVLGYRIEPITGNEVEKLEFDQKLHAFRVPRGITFRLRLYGTDVNIWNTIAFTKQSPNISSSEAVTYCDKLGHSRAYPLKPEIIGSEAIADVLFNTEIAAKDILYHFCLEYNGTGAFIYQGQHMIVYQPEPYLIPLPLQFALICLCLSLSWLFSGLNLGLMSLDCTELDLIVASGSTSDRRFAKALKPIRKRGNTLLCTILLGNTIVNSCCTLLLDDIIGQGLYAVLGSTAGIVCFGEILPQAICSRYGLKVGYYTRYIIQFFMYALYPVTFSIGKLLDCIFGHEITTVYSRDKLREIVRMSAYADESGEHLLKQEELNILTGALQMNETTVRDIMVDRNDVFMLDVNQNITYDLIALIARTGYTRIPIYANGDRDNIVGLLHTTDLMGIDPEDKMPLNALIKFYGREIVRVDEDRTILDMLNTFKEAKVHLAIVDRVNLGSNDSDPTRKVVGIVTLEDVIEFILRDEIVDEKEILKEVARQDEEAEKTMASRSAGRLMGQWSEIIPQQLWTAATQFLMANVEPFRKEVVERKVLARLLRFPGLFVIKRYNAGSSNENLLYSFNEPADFFTLILQGSCYVYIGRDKLRFEGGPFYYFGLDALTTHSEHSDEKNTTTKDNARSDSLTSVSPNYSNAVSIFKPDFTVEITSDIQYIRMTLAMYRALINVTQLARLLEKCDDSEFLVDKLYLELKQNHAHLDAQGPAQSPVPSRYHRLTGPRMSIFPHTQHHITTGRYQRKHSSTQISETPKISKVSRTTSILDSVGGARAVWFKHRAQSIVADSLPQ